MRSHGFFRRAPYRGKQLSVRASSAVFSVAFPLDGHTHRRGCCILYRYEVCLWLYCMPTCRWGCPETCAGSSGQQAVPAAGPGPGAGAGTGTAAGGVAEYTARDAVVKYEYVAQGPEQLSFQVGDIVRLHTAKVRMHAFCHHTREKAV